ncbi:MAG: Obg family GTPase CgtA, partial [bacterium]|nr:Obg family GTPase CgtA [bacterium]
RDGRSFTVADLPGLIKGASLGEGLGDKFLKHIERTRVIAHVIDMSGLEGRTPYNDYEIIKKELNDFDSSLLKRKSLIIANKMDMEQSKNNLEEFKKKLKEDVKIFEVSAITGKGLDEVITYMADVLDELPEIVDDKEKYEDYILYKFEKEEPFIITKENDMFVITGEKIEKLFRMTKFTTDEAVLRFAKKLTRMGVDKKLEDMGAVQGDKVRILDYIFEYRN